MLSSSSIGVVFQELRSTVNATSVSLGPNASEMFSFSSFGAASRLKRLGALHDQLYLVDYM